MLVVRTTENPAHSIREFVGSEQSVGLDDLSLAVYPLWLDGVLPRTLLGKQATYDPHSLAAFLDPTVVFSEPASDLFGDVPASVVPDEKQNLLAYSLQLLRQLHSRNRVVMALTGLPSTNLSHVSSNCGRSSP